MNYIESRLEDLISILKDASFYALQLQSSNLKISNKPDGSYITNADLAMNEFLKFKIKEIFGDVKFLSEENDAEENNNAKNSGSYFLIDPIDGTENFIQNTDFSINLCFIENHEALISIIAIPKQDLIIFNDSKNVYTIKGNKNAEILTHKKNKNILNAASIVVGNRTNEDEEFMLKVKTILLKNNYEFNIEVSTAGIKFLMLLLNQKNLLCISYHKIAPWDIEPFILLLDRLCINYCEIENKELDKKYFIASTDKILYNTFAAELK